MGAPSDDTCLREILLHYRSFLSLKNNWQFSSTPDARLALFRTTIDYIDGYTSFVKGSGLMPKANRPSSSSLLETYRTLEQSLKALGRALGV
jgi:hypothetical protein